MISVAAASNRLPVLPCNSCYRHEPLREIHCIPFTRGKLALPRGVSTRAVNWGEAPDASVNHVTDYREASRDEVIHLRVRAFRRNACCTLFHIIYVALPSIHIHKLATSCSLLCIHPVFFVRTDVSQGVLVFERHHLQGWTQSWYAFKSHETNVCWGLRPRDEIQAEARRYFDQILVDNNVTLTKDTKVVVAHLRRGDYVVKQSTHGLLTVEYYNKGLAMIRSRIAKENTAAATEGMVVIVMTEQESVDWCRNNLKWGPESGVKQTICANAKGKRCKGEIVDMLAMSLGQWLRGARCLRPSFCTKGWSFKNGQHDSFNVLIGFIYLLGNKGDYLIIANSTFSWWAHFFRVCARKFKNWLIKTSERLAHQPDQTGLSVFPHRLP